MTKIWLVVLALSVITLVTFPVCITYMLDNYPEEWVDIIYTDCVLTTWVIVLFTAYILDTSNKGNGGKK